MVGKRPVRVEPRMISSSNDIWEAAAGCDGFRAIVDEVRRNPGEVGGGVVNILSVNEMRSRVLPPDVHNQLFWLRPAKWMPD